MGYLFIAVIVIAGLTFLGLSFKTWKLFHIFTLFFLLISVIIFMRSSALVMKTRLAWTLKGEELQEVNDKIQAELQIALHGSETNPKQTLDTLKYAKMELRRLQFERGRIWRDCECLGGPPFNVNIPTVAPPAGAAGPVTAALAVNDEVFAFREDMLPAISNRWKVPTSYIGQFVVTAVNGTALTLTPSIPLTADEVNTALGGSWVIYERMPLDSHEIFATETSRFRKESMALDPEQVFEEAFTRDELMVLFPQTPGMSNEDYEALIDGYRFDGRQLSEIAQEVESGAGRIKPTFDPPPENQAVLVTFKGKHSIDPNGTPSATGPLSQDAFDSRGQAQGVKLIQMERDPTSMKIKIDGLPVATEFVAGDEGFFDSETFDSLEEAGLADVENRYFLRDLVDYEYSFHTNYLQQVIIRSRTEAARRDTADLQQITDKVDKEVAYRESERDKLTEDKVNHLGEKTSVEAYRGTLSQNWAALQQEIRELYRATLYYEQELAAMDQELLDDVNRRTKAVISGAE